MLYQLMLSAALLAAPSGGGQAATARTAQAAEAPIVREARAFMEGYARDLLAGNGAAIADRYDSRGALLQGYGGSRMESERSTRSYYTSGEWKPPTDFVWEDLHFEPLSPDAIVVAGIFLDEAPQRPLRIVSYTGLLVRRDGKLRIRIEHLSSNEKR